MKVLLQDRSLIRQHEYMARQHAIYISPEDFVQLVTITSPYFQKEKTPTILTAQV